MTNLTTEDVEALEKGLAFFKQLKNASFGGTNRALTDEEKDFVDFAESALKKAGEK